MTRIVDLRVFDLRFPTSQSLDGSDAMNPDPDYSAAYVILQTDTPGSPATASPSPSAAAMTSAAWRSRPCAT